MRQSPVKKWLLGALGASLAVAPLAIAQVATWGTAGASVGVDTIQYVQSADGHSGSYVQYVPGDGSAPTSQPITAARGDGDGDADDCGTPTVSGAPILSFSALVYNRPVNRVPYTGWPSAAAVGTSKGRTGACAIQPNWAINESESLIFSVGSNPLVAGRLLTEANLQFQRQDKGSDPPLQVKLIERNGSAVVASQTSTLTGGSGTTWTVDTGLVLVGFSSIEIQVTSPSSWAAISVVGPSSTFSFAKLNQTIHFTNTPPTSPSVGATYTVSAVATSGLPVTFSVDAGSTSGCTVDPSSGFVTLSAPAGTCVIDANQSGNGRFSPAPQVQQSVMSTRIAQSIAFTNSPPASPHVNDAYTVTAAASSGLPVTFSVDEASTSGCTVDGTGLVTLSGPAGTCIIDANQAGNPQYLPAPQVEQSVTVLKSSQSVTFTSTPPTSAAVGSTYQASASSSSGLPVTYSIDPSSTSGCTVDPVSGLVTFTAPSGLCVIDATQGGDASYSPGSAQQTVGVYQVICGQQTIATSSTDGSTQSGQINASVTFQDYNGQPAPQSVCKTYNAFTATTQDPIPSIGGSQTVTFSSQPLPTAHVVTSITWAFQAFCTPDGAGDTTQCPPTYVSLDNGVTWTPQVFCTSAQSAGVEWCTTSKTYAYSPSGTQITETWDGYGDPLFHNGSG
jgi:hypothetical protein